MSKIPVTYAKRIVVEVVFSKVGERNGLYSLTRGLPRGRMLLHQYIRGKPVANEFPRFDEKTTLAER
eukprot:scaffold5705_cov82-Cylindrotheca_fusiformis.AAC.1